MSPSWLAENCPRLTRARDALLAERHRHRAESKRRRDELHHWERVLAHRELQIVRAMHTRDPAYIARRQRKLAAAQQKVRQLKRQVAWDEKAAAGQPTPRQEAA